MGTKKRPSSPGERLVAAYLDQRGLPWEHEPDVGGRNPDFVARWESHPVALEVFEPSLELPGRVGSFDPIAPIEGAFADRKKKQIKAVKEAGLPLVLVIGSTYSDVPYDVLSLAGVMFGRPGVRMQVDATGAGSEPQTAFLGRGKTQPTVNRGVSALARIRRFNPTQWRLEGALRAPGLVGRPQARTPRERREVLERMSEVEERLTQGGLYQPEAREARLEIVHNPFATHPLPLAFAGLHDDQYGLTGATQSSWGLVAQGRLRWEVPGD